MEFKLVGTCPSKSIILFNRGRKRKETRMEGLKVLKFSPNRASGKEFSSVTRAVQEVFRSNKMKKRWGLLNFRINIEGHTGSSSKSQLYFIT